MQFTSAVIFLFFSFSTAQSFDQPELAVSYEPAQEQQEQAYEPVQQPEERQFIDVYTDPETGLYYEYNDQDDTFYQVAPSELEFYPVDEEQAQAFENALQAEYAASAASDEEDAEYAAEQDFSGAQEDQEYEDDQDEYSSYAVQPPHSDPNQKYLKYKTTMGDNQQGQQGHHQQGHHGQQHG